MKQKEIQNKIKIDVIIFGCYDLVFLIDVDAIKIDS